VYRYFLYAMYLNAQTCIFVLIRKAHNSDALMGIFLQHFERHNLREHKVRIWVFHMLDKVIQLHNREGVRPENDLHPALFGNVVNRVDVLVARFVNARGDFLKETALNNVNVVVEINADIHAFEKLVKFGRNIFNK